jgi:bifunctional non-homologous end joining protein LigD
MTGSKRLNTTATERDGKRVRRWTRNGHNWTDRFPLIVEAAPCATARPRSLDGEAVLLGVDGICDFDGLHTRRSGIGALAARALR